MKKFMFLIISGCLLTSVSTLAGSVNKTHFERTVKFSFNVNNNAHFQLSNEYGDITFYRWDKNVISATVTIKVKTDNEEMAKKMAEGIQILKEQNGNSVTLKTNYNNSNNSHSSFWTLFFGGGVTTRKSIRIDYKVYLPKSLGELNVQNKYGDISGNQIPGVTHIQLSYGHFHLSDAQQPFYMQVKYGEGVLRDIADAMIKSSYTDFHLDRIKQLKLHYKYGDLRIGQAEAVFLDGSYGDIDINRVDDLQSNTSYSDYAIDYIGTRATIKTAYGDVKIDKTGSHLQQLYVTLQYADLSAGISSGMPLNITGSLQYGDMDTDLNDLVVDENVEKGTQSDFKAHISGANGAVIQIEGKYSDVQLENN